MTLRTALAPVAAALCLAAAAPAPAASAELCPQVFGTCFPPGPGDELPCLTLDVPPQFVPCP